MARDQVRLGAAKALGLALDGMSYRIFRSSITVAILALAVAFLVHVSSYAALARATAQSCRAELAGTRAARQFITRLARADPRASVENALLSGDAARLEEYARWAPEVRNRLQEAGRIAGDFSRAAAYLDNLPVATRAALLGDASASDVLGQLGDSRRLRSFEDRLSSLGVIWPLGDAATFRRLVTEERWRLDHVMDRIIAGHRAVVQRVRSAYPKADLAELVVEPPPEFYAMLEKLGFVLPAAPGKLREFARRERDLKALERLVLTDSVRATAARELDVALGEVSFDVVADAVGHAGSAGWLAAALSSASAARRFEPGRVATLLEGYRRERRLRAVVARADPALQAGLMGASSKNRWLVVLSFVVCVVGVANAMLMSVTERFTEIATMKCLGAMDRFIMATFVFEAAVQGVVGGLCGVVLGLALAAMRGLVEFGDLFAGSLAALVNVGLSALAPFAAGVVLAMLAAVGPAFVAARLAPMEAMRVE